MHRNSNSTDPARAHATANFYRAAARARLDFNAVRAAAAGRWPALLVLLLAALVAGGTR